MKLTKTQKAEHAARLVAYEAARDTLITAREAHQVAVQEAFFKLEEAVTAYNTALATAWETHLTAPLAAYTRETEALTEYVTETAEALREQVFARSERWQESEAGQAAEAMVSEWEAFEAETYEPDELPALDLSEHDPRDQFSEEPEDLADTFGALPLDSEDA